MTSTQEDIINHVTLLLNKYEEIEDLSEETIATQKQETLYHEYWHLLYDNFGNEIINRAKQSIGHGKFMTYEFLDSLKEVLDRMPRLVDEYQDYSLKYCEDCWGAMSYFVFYNRSQYSESLDFISDETAKIYFRRAIDENPAEPDFFD